MDAMGRPCLKCQPSSRTGENPPYGMIGGTVETSASFEARYAPLSYPTTGKENSESILASSLAGDIARYRLKRRQRYWWAGLLSFEKPMEQDADSAPMGGRQHSNHVNSQ